MITIRFYRCLLSPIIEEFLYFHDFTNIILIFILRFVGLIIVSIVFNKIVNKGLLEGQILECIWTIIPAFILVQIALPSISLLYLIEDAPHPDLTVKVIRNQWFWSYEYSDFSFDCYIIPEDRLILGSGRFRQLETDNRLALPFYTKIRLLVTRSDVLHSWTVPSLGVKADAVPGRINQINFVAPLPATLYGQCSEICGSQHSRIPIAVDFIPLKEWNIWRSEWFTSDTQEIKADVVPGRIY